MSKEDQKLNLEELATFCKKKGFVFQAAEIYGGFAGFFDFGPLGVELKNNLKQLYWREFVHRRDDLVGQDGSIITNPKVWEASGHVATFGDMLLTTKDTKTKLRADHFIEDELNIAGDALGPKEIEDLIVKNNLKYNGEDFELPIQFFSGMLQTQIGADVTKQSKAYLRPETAQSIFPNFKSVAETSRQTLPFGITQIGKAYRNEISPRDFVFRCREFEQIEMEYFFNPEVETELFTKELQELKVQVLLAETQDNGKSDMVEKTLGQLVEENRINQIHAYWLGTFFNFFNKSVGLSWENLRIREHTKTELSHYSQATMDIDYKYSMGYKEMMGLAYRGNYDLSKHQEYSKTKMEVFDESTKSKVIPHVIEPSFGVERFMMAVIYEAYTDDQERGNVVLSVKPSLAPYKVAVLPLVKKDPIGPKAKEIYDELIEEDIQAFYDESGSVGKRYARQDEIGTPYCITIDYETIEEGENKGTVTIRDRDSTNQVRVKVEEVSQIIRNLMREKIKFEDLQ